METTQITVTIPKDAARYINPDDLRTKLMMLYPAVADMKISRGRAGELLGIRKLDTLDMLERMDIPYITQTWEEVQEDIAACEAAMQNAHVKAANA